MTGSEDWSFSSTADEVVKAFQDRVGGRTFLITGASTQSIGEATAIALASSPKPPSILILAGRSQEKVLPVVEKVLAISREVTVIFVPLDLSSQASVEAAAERIISDSRVRKIDVLINNAGIMACPYIPSEWNEKDKAPLEQQLAVNYIGTFLFTSLLATKILKASPGARIINLSSSGHRFGGIRWDDLGFQGGRVYDAWDAYGQSKTAIILFTIALAAKYKNLGITTFAVHPGAVMTALGRYMQPEGRAAVIDRLKTISNFETLQRKSAQQGCATTLRAALDPELEEYSGSYMSDCQVAEQADHAKGVENAQKLWKLTEQILRKSF
ncbi:Short-chain dehydrogenase [Talaromyces pinophilus]|nr:Short-chain dehydrogenase [Talaromyces pinophilus]